MNISDLKDFRRQVDNAIGYLEAGLPTFPMTEREIASSRTEHGGYEFIIGDYVIYRRARTLRLTVPVTHNPQGDAFGRVEPK